MGGSGMQAGGALCTQGTAPTVGPLWKPTGSPQTGRHAVLTCPRACGCQDQAQGAAATAPANCQRAAAGPRVHEGLPGQRAPRAGSRCSFAPCGPVRLGETPPVAPALFRPPPLGRAPHAGAHELRAAHTRCPRTRSGHARAQMRRRSPPPHGLRPPGPQVSLMRGTQASCWPRPGTASKRLQGEHTPLLS